MLEEKLQKLGLNKTEIDVYLTVLKRGQVSPNRISIDTNIKRPTVYAAAEELIRKRLIEEDITAKTKRYVPRSLNYLKNYTREERNDLDEKDSIIEELIPDLEELSSSGKYSVPKVRMVAPNDVEAFLYDQSPKWMQSMVDTKETTWWGYQSDDYFKLKINTDFIDWYWKKCPPLLDLKIFTDTEEEERRMLDKNTYPRRHTKQWQGQEFTAGVWIMGDYIVNVITQDEQQYLIQIQDKVLAESQRVLYKKLWEEAE
jgi:sugar-specific transcriptional regulator TrmB